MATNMAITEWWQGDNAGPASYYDEQIVFHEKLGYIYHALCKMYKGSLYESIDLIQWGKENLEDDVYIIHVQEGLCISTKLIDDLLLIKLKL